MQDHDATKRPGRHRARTRIKKVHVLALAGLAAIGLGATAGSASADPTAQDWANIRQCESGGNYGINTGNGYYGAYQFDLSTWRSVGGSGLPSDASPAEQDARALALWRSRGWGPWACASMVSLSAGDAAPAPVVVATVAPKATPYPKVSGTVAAQFTEQLYRRLLGRSGAGNPFAAALTSGQASYTTVAKFISNSLERRARIVDAAYLACLGRHVDSSGRNAYSAWISNGSLTGLYEAICGSTEAYNRAHKNLSTWVDNTYVALLGRHASAREQAVWANNAAHYGRASSVAAVVNGATWRNSQLDKVYLAVLGRHVDAAGVATYSAAIGNRGIFTTPVGLITAPEFLSKVGAR